MSFGKQLRQLRQIHKQTLADVASATDLSVSHISNIERDKSEPTLDTVRKLAIHFNVPTTQFLTEPGDFPLAFRPKHKASFRGFVEQMNGRVDSSMQNLLLHIDARANKPAASVDDWLQYYYVISAITTKG